MDQRLFGFSPMTQTTLGIRRAGPHLFRRQPCAARQDTADRAVFAEPRAGASGFVGADGLPRKRLVLRCRDPEVRAGQGPVVLEALAFEIRGPERVRPRPARTGPGNPR